MANSVIGALRVSLGIDSAQFEAGLKKAQAGLGRFGKSATISFAAIGAAGVAAASGLALLTLKAANSADALSKTAQKVGVTTEALSRLKYAADFSDVSLEQLSTGLGRLSKSMLEAATNSKGTAATAFSALGVSVKDASGNLRGANEVFTDIADKLSRMEDGALKTAVAQRVFGKSGAELIPLLNEGAAGLKRFADESDRTGNTLATSTGKAAEKFNDTLAEVGKSLEGVSLKVLEAALPAMQRFADTLTSPAFQQAAQDWGSGIVGVLDWIAKRTIEVTDLFRGLGNVLNDASNKDIFGNTKAPSELAMAKGRFDAKKSLTGNLNSGNFSSPDAGFFAGMFPGAAGAPPLPDVKPFTIDLDALAAAGGKAKLALDPFAARVAEMSDVLTATVDPFAQMKLDLTDLGTMLQEKRIDAEQFGMAVQKTIAGATGSFAGLAGEALGALSQIFDGNKELAVASAIVNGIGSIAKTLETYGVTPWGIAAAGVAAVTAAANVASILSTSQSSKSMPGTGAPSAAVSTPAQQAPRSAVNVTLNGQSYGRDQIRDLLDQIKDVVGDGYDFRIS